MGKSSKLKKEKSSYNSINVDGDVSNSVLIAGNKNKVTIQFEQIKTTYGLFTIPQPVTDFTGREAELEGLKASFTNGAIITGLSGAGGIGKTELARKLAHDIAENFPDAQINIDLLGTAEKPTSPEDAMRRLLEPFYVGQKLPNDETQLKGLYQQTFGKKKVLLLLDNAANVAQVRPLIPPAPSAAIITSRQHFSLTEFGWQGPLQLRVLSPEESRMFLRNASNKLNQTTDDDIEQLSSLCGYLPLALRIAISLLNDRRDYTLKILINSLIDEHTRLKRLKRENDVDFDMEAVISLSYNLLPTEIRQRFYSLAIFNGYFWTGSVASIWDIDSEDEVSSVLGILLNRNLINTLSGPFGLVGKSETIQMNYYFFHDLTKLFASELLYTSVDEAKIVIERHAYYYLQLAIVILKDSVNKNFVAFHNIWPEIFAAWQRMQPDYFIQPDSSFAEQWINNFYIIYSHATELGIPVHHRIEIEKKALNDVEIFQDKYPGISDLPEDIELEDNWVPKEIVHLNNLGDAYYSAGDSLSAISVLRKALDVLKSTVEISEFASKSLRASIYGNLGNAHLALMETDEAFKYYEDQLSISREINDKGGEATVLGNIGNYYNQIGDIQNAINYYEEQLSLSRKIGYKRAEGDAFGNMAVAFNKLGMKKKALEYHKKAIAIARETGDKRRVGILLIGVGLIHDNISDLSTTVKIYEQAINILREVGDRKSEAEALVNLGSAYYGHGEKEKTRQYWESALTIFLETGDPRQQETQSQIDRLDIQLIFENFKQLDTQEFSQLVINSVASKSLKAKFLFEGISKLLCGNDIVAETRELLVVLQKILVGIKNPDITGLSETDKRLLLDKLQKLQ